jgi:hypothetical protein
MTEIVTPTFIIGGAPKAGTTSLYHYLDQHPQVCMSARKETSVFIDGKSLRWLSENYYRHYNGEKAVGEASAGTLGNPEVTQRISRVLPEVQFIFILRDPVERLYSHFTFLQGVQAISPETSFSSFIRSQGDWRDTLIDLGRYHKHLTRFEEYFDREQMLVLLFKDLTSDPVGFAERVYRYIRVNPTFQPDIEVRNPTREPRFPMVHRLLSRVWESARDHVDVYFRNQTRPIRRAIKQLVMKEAERSSMDSEDQTYLRDIYRSPNRKLEEWMGNDLSHWE